LWAWEIMQPATLWQVVAYGTLYLYELNACLYYKALLCAIKHVGIAL